MQPSVCAPPSAQTARAQPPLERRHPCATARAQPFIRSRPCAAPRPRGGGGGSLTSSALAPRQSPSVRRSIIRFVSHHSNLGPTDYICIPADAIVSCSCQENPEEVQRIATWGSVLKRL